MVVYNIIEKNKKMKKIAIALLLLIPMFATAQSGISVGSFYKSENDLKAREAKVKDINNKLCALLIIETTEKGFKFEANGVNSTEQKDGEIWVFLSPRSRFITIKHEVLGTLRDYEFPETIESGEVYIMKLIHGSTRYIIEEAVTEQHLVIRTQTQGAKIFINDEYVGDKEGTKLLSITEEHTYRVEAPMYHAKTGTVRLSADSKTELEVDLMPAFGYLQVNTVPDNVDIEIDGKTYRTPTITLTLESGTYTIKAFKKMYKSMTKQAVVEDGDTNIVNITLQPNFATLVVNASDNEAGIYIDGIFVSNNTCSKKLEAGKHKIEVKKDRHRSYTKTIDLENGMNITENIPALTPLYGKLNITTNPSGAEIVIDGKSYGTTPNIIQKILVGEHTVTFTKEGYSALTKTIKIEEGKIADYSFDMPLGNLVNIMTNIDGAKLYVNGKFVGESPKELRLPFGRCIIDAEYNGVKVSEELIVSDSEKQNVTLLLNKDILVESNKNNVKIYVNGDTTSSGTAPIKLTLPLGKHSISANYKGEVITKDINMADDNIPSIMFKYRAKRFITADYSYTLDPGIHKYGLTYGIAGTYFGVYFGLGSTFNFGDITFLKDNENIFYTGESSQTIFSGNIGMMLGKRSFYWRLGAECDYAMTFWQKADYNWINSSNGFYLKPTMGFQIMKKYFVFSLDVIAPYYLDSYYNEILCWGAKVGLGIKF